MKTARGWAAMLPQTGRNVIILDGYEFGFEQWELDEIQEDWERGMDYEDIAKRLVRYEMEIFLALVHLADKGKIKRPFAFRPKNKK